MIMVYVRIMVLVKSMKDLIIALFRTAGLDNIVKRVCTAMLFS